MSLSTSPAVHVPPSILRRDNISVTSDGELVAIHIGNATLRLHYEDALTISQWIRVRAKESKRRAGDNSRHWSAIAVLEGHK